MLRKYQTITIFALFACMLSFIVACSNDDVPVGEDEMEIPGASIGSRLVGMWVCTETDNESLIPVGFHFTVSQELKDLVKNNFKTAEERRFSKRCTSN